MFKPFDYTARIPGRRRSELGQSGTKAELSGDHVLYNAALLPRVTSSPQRQPLTQFHVYVQGYKILYEGTHLTQHRSFTLS